jgi:PAS domain S-box-containing protein
VAENIRVWQHFLDTGEPFQFEHRVRPADGKYRWHISRALPMRDEAGQVVMWVGSNTDIDGQKRTEAALRESEQRFRAQVTASAQIVWTTGPDGAVIEHSPSWRAFTGQTYEQWKGFGWLDAMHLEDRERTAEAWQRAVASKMPFQTEYRIRHISGEWRWTGVRAVPVFNQDGSVRQWVGMNIDIAERKQTEALLKEREEKYRTLVEQSYDLICEATDNGQFSYVSSNFKSILGYEPDELLGRSIFEHIHLDDHAAVITEVQEARSTFSSSASTYRYRHKNGEWRWLESTGKPFETAVGEIRLIIATRYITERKRWQEQIESLNETLEQRVTERTTQLQSVNNELEAFSYSVSHDCAPRLRAIDGFSKALLDDYAGKLDARDQNDLARVRAATQRMAELIDDLPNLSRLTRTKLARTTLDLSALAQTIAEELQAEQPERQVEFVIAPGMVVDADGSLMRVVLTNLIGNAWKFTGKRARIEVGRSSDEDQGPYFVRDDGCGFDMAYAGKLFSAFQRLHSCRGFEGTGVGLALVQRIIFRHGGRV